MKSSYQCALITGASSGLGEEFARQLAPYCATMILVARRADRLAALAQNLAKENTHSLHIKCYEADLKDEAARIALADILATNNLHPDLLVNNAGLGDYGTFADSSWARVKAMLRVNMEALTHLSHIFLPKMIEHGGAIIHVSSLASILPMPDFAVYAATKAYVSSFSEALRIELMDYRIPVVALCPGPVHTEFGEVAMRDSANKKESSFREFFYTDKARVVSEAITGLTRNQARVYPGWQIAVAAAGLSLLPAFLLRVIMSKRPRKM